MDVNDYPRKQEEHDDDYDEEMDPDYEPGLFSDQSGVEDEDEDERDDDEDADHDPNDENNEATSFYQRRRHREGDDFLSDEEVIPQEEVSSLLDDMDEHVRELYYCSLGLDVDEEALKAQQMEEEEFPQKKRRQNVFAFDETMPGGEGMDHLKPMKGVPIPRDGWMWYAGSAIAVMLAVWMVRQLLPETAPAVTSTSPGVHFPRNPLPPLSDNEMDVDHLKTRLAYLETSMNQIADVASSLAAEKSIEAVEKRLKDFDLAGHAQQQSDVGSPDNLAAFRSVVHDMISTELERFSNDKLGLPDYALESGGGRVVRELTTPTYQAGKPSEAASAPAASWGLFSLIPRRAVPESKTPNTAIQADTTVGSCWPMEGSQGKLTIKLSRRIIPTNFTLEHISKSIALQGDLRSAPKDVEVWGLSGPDDSNPETKIKLASYMYDVDAPSAAQNFPIEKMLYNPLTFIQLRVLSNYGHEHYTCLYRFRVHGV